MADKKSIVTVKPATVAEPLVPAAAPDEVVETPKPATAEPAPKKSAAVRMMTRLVGGPVATGGAKAKAQRIADATKPTQKPGGGGSSRVVRRGAAKGR